MGKPGELDGKINSIIVEQNCMAANVRAEENVPVDDFYSLLAPHLDLARGDPFHWKPEAYKLLAEQTTTHSQSVIARRQVTPLLSQRKSRRHNTTVVAALTETKQ
jgi:hypothetical protein